MTPLSNILIRPVRTTAQNPQVLETGDEKNAKKRAVVAVARKLAVLLHRLWVTAEVYEPLRNDRSTIGPQAVSA